MEEIGRMFVGDCNSNTLETVSARIYELISFGKTVLDRKSLFSKNLFMR